MYSRRWTSVCKLALLLLLPAVLAAAPAVKGEDEMPAIEEIRAKYQERLLQLPGVVSVGIGLDEDGKKVIVIGLAEKQPDTERRLPATLESYTVQTRVMGTPRATDAPGK